MIELPSLNSGKDDAIWKRYMALDNTKAAVAIPFSLE